jgi:thiol-disulfide isomerase/thioredoxin
MKSKYISSWLIAFAGVAMLAPWAAAADVPASPSTDSQTSTLKLIPSGAMNMMGGYMPKRLELAETRPADLAKAPEMESPMYGQMKFGGKSYIIALDEPAGKPAKLYVDSNGNGDLTDDAPAPWSSKEYTIGGKKILQYSGSMQLPLQTPGTPTLVTLGAYRFDKNDPARAAMKNVLMYYVDYGYSGDINIGGATYHAMLVNDNADGDFRGTEPTAKTRSGTRLMVDINGDGKFDGRAETFDARKPFNIKGTTYELADLTAGGSFRVAKSNKTVDEIPLPPDLSKGHHVLAFKATKTDGTEVNFPSDYKGKLVFLDFWATWCGPCMGEVPGLVKAYNNVHAKGLDILGISLDQPNALEKVKSVTADKGMTWPQVYDGKFWEARIAQLYGIQSIPAAFLVDGDTGIVIASGNALRGENLAKTLDDALAVKAKQNATN